MLGTEDSTPLEFWVGIEDGTYLQLDDVVMVQTDVPGAGPLRVSGLVDMVRARHEGSRFDTDVFLADQGLLPVETARAAHVVSTRFEPELYVPPRPGDAVVRDNAGRRATRPCTSTRWRRSWSPASRATSLPIYIDLSFLDGRRGAHVNISGISGVATKTTYASFLLYGLFHSQVLGNEAANTKALIFNVKGEDLLFLDKPNARLSDEPTAPTTRRLGSRPGRSSPSGLWAPVKRGVGGRGPRHRQPPASA